MARINWNKAMQETVVIVKNFVKMGVKPTVRTVYYALVSKELIPNTRSAYQGLCKNLVEARKKGFVSWKNIADETRETTGSDTVFWKPDEYAEAYVEYLFERLRDFKLPRWLNQDYYVEVWIEKSALKDTFRNWLGDFNVVIVPSRGYSSWTFLYEAQDRIKKVVENTGREVVILYFGDFDPSGRDIERFIEEALGWFEIDAEIRNIAVTKTQIEAYNLPSTPEDTQEIAKMKRDPRFKNWEHGLFRVELDSLVAYVPDEVERIVKESVEDFFDEKVYDKVLERQEEERKEAWNIAKKLLDEKIEEIREEEEEG